MAKRGLGINVFEAAQERIRVVFDSFPHIYVSFSGGKDSSVLVHLAAEEARRTGRKFGLLLIDLEAQYTATIQHALDIFDLYQDVAIPYWVALPIALRNAVSSFQPKWTAWGNDADWVRSPPDIAITDQEYFPFFRYDMEFEEFVEDFGPWYGDGRLTCCMVGIRAQESLNRYRAITSSKKSRFLDHCWTTRKGQGVYNAYPLYDWRTEDIWAYFGRTGKAHNTLYDQMHLAGISIHEQRICQPYGDDQRKGLDLFHLVEPDTWERVLKRVAGANFGALYCKTTGNILGRIKAEKPEGMSWEAYADLLLTTLPEASREHFECKIKVFLNWWADRGYERGIPDEADPKAEAAKKVPSWRRICKTLLKNDWWCKSLSFSMTSSKYYDRYKKTIKRKDKKWIF